MNFLQKLRRLLAIRLPNWLGIFCLAILAFLVLVLLFVLLFPDLVGNFIVEHDIRFLQ